MIKNRGITTDRNLSQHTHKGVNTTVLIEKILRERVFDSLYYKLHCFNTNVAMLLDRMVELTCVGGIDTAGKPFPFVCLLVKLIQLFPEREVIEFMIHQQEFKYMKVLALVYCRLVYRDRELLAAELSDYRKIIVYEHGWSSSTVDSIVDVLLTEDYFIGLTLTYMASS